MCVCSTELGVQDCFSPDRSSQQKIPIEGFLALGGTGMSRVRCYLCSGLRLPFRHWLGLSLVITHLPFLPGLPMANVMNSPGSLAFGHPDTRLVHLICPCGRGIDFPGCSSTGESFSGAFKHGSPCAASRWGACLEVDSPGRKACLPLRLVVYTLPQKRWFQFG